MANEPTPKDLAYAAGADLEARLAKAAALTDDQKKLIASAKAALEEGFGKAPKGAVLPDQAATNSLITEVFDKLKGSPEKGAKDAAAHIAEEVRAFSTANFNDRLAALGKSAADEAIGGKPGAVASAVEDSIKIAHVPIDGKAADERLAAMADRVAAGEAYAKKVAETTKDVTPERLTAMNAEVAPIVTNDLTGAIGARHEHITTEQALKAAATDGKLSDADTAKIKGLATTAETAEQGVLTKIKAFFTNSKGKGEPETAKIMTQAHIDELRASNPEIAQKWEEIAASKTSTKLGEVEGMLNTTRQKAVAGIETSTSQKLSEVASGMASGGSMGKLAKYGIAGAGVAVAGIALKNAMADKPVDPQTNEKPKMSFMGKITTALAIVGGVAIAATALREGNPAEGWKKASEAGKGWVDKVKAASASAMRTGDFGRA